jgi:hypothetical protein
VDSRNRAAMPCIEQLEKVKSLAAANLAQDDAIGPVTNCCFQKIANGHGRQTVLLAPSFESEDIFFLNLYLCRVLDPHHTFMLRDETRCQLRLAYVRKRSKLSSSQSESAQPASASFLCAIFGNHHFSRRKGVRASQAYAYLRYGRIKKKVAPLKGFPTIEEVERADKEQLARWYRFLPSGETAADQKVMRRISERFEELGGMTAELNKKIGM